VAQPDDRAETGPAETVLLSALAGVSAQRLLLVSDYDGTLADIVSDPSDALPWAESLSALGRLTQRLGRVVILSGRSNGDLRRFLPVPGLILRGDYGLAEPNAAELEALSRLEQALWPELPPGCRLDRKPASLSVHHRAAPAAGEHLQDLVRRLADPALLRWRPGRLVIEVMPARADKGLALREEIDAHRPEAVIFAGDDTGDQRCFEITSGLSLPHLAVGIRSPEAPPELFQACDLVLERPADWGRLLTRLALWAEEPGPGDRAAGG